MWVNKYEKHNFKKGLKENIPDDFFTSPCSEEEYEDIKNYTEKKHTELIIPQFLKLPEEYIKLLKISNGGMIINKEREFSFFDIETIREFYICYGFIIHAPTMLPIAFNGGGTFYAYKFIDEKQPPKIYGVHSSCIGFEKDTCFLGNSLKEVLSKDFDIDEEIYEYQVKNGTIKTSKITKEEKEIINLTNQLKELKEKKNTKKINLKEYLKSKREIESKLKELR